MEQTNVKISAADVAFGFDSEDSWPEQLSQQATWIRFWQQPWLLCHSSWLRSDHIASPVAAREFMAGAHPNMLRHKLQVKDVPPPKPDQSLLELVGLDFSTRMHALLLATEVVKPGFSVVEITVDASSREWCRRLAKAIMPGSWSIVRHYPLPLMYLSGSLLKEWIEPVIWPRLRLLFDRHWVGNIERVSPKDIGAAKTPFSKLNQLWQAVIWRAGLETQPDITRESHTTEPRGVGR